MHDPVPDLVPRNHLLASLPPAEWALLAPELERIPLEARRLLYDVDRPIAHVHFMEEGIASILSVLLDGSAVETATIGREGMVGMAAFHGVDRTAEQAMVQVPGEGLRLPVARLRALLPQLPTLDAALHRFTVYVFTLAAQNSACNRRHTIEQRCARWLLMVHDRLEGDVLAITHEFLAQMLGVRRASVTDALAALEALGAVRAERGRIVVTDRAALEGASCECYRIIASVQATVLGGRPTPSPLALVETSRGGESVLGTGPGNDEPA